MSERRATYPSCGRSDSTRTASAVRRDGFSSDAARDALALLGVSTDGTRRVPPARSSRRRDVLESAGRLLTAIGGSAVLFLLGEGTERQMLSLASVVWLLGVLIAGAVVHVRQMQRATERRPMAVWEHAYYCGRCDGFLMFMPAADLLATARKDSRLRVGGDR